MSSGIQHLLTGVLSYLIICAFPALRAMFPASLWGGPSSPWRRQGSGPRRTGKSGGRSGVWGGGGRRRSRVGGGGVEWEEGAGGGGEELSRQKKARCRIWSVLREERASSFRTVGRGLQVKAGGN